MPRWPKMLATNELKFVSQSHGRAINRRQLSFARFLLSRLAAVLDPDLIDSFADARRQLANGLVVSQIRKGGLTACVMTYFMGDESAQFAKLRPRLSPLCLERPLDLRQPELRRIASTSAAALTAYRPRGPRDATCKSTAGDLFPRKATKIDRKRRVCTVWTTSPASSRPTANISEDITNMNELKHSQRSARSVEIDNPSGKGALYKHFFDRLVDELRDKHKFTNAKAGAPKNWHTFGAGTSGFTYAAVFASGGRIRVEVYIDLGKRASNVAALEVLQAQESALSKAFAEPLQWELLEGKQACRIAVYRSGAIEDTAEFLEQYHRWMAQRLLLFKEVFGAQLAAVAQEAEKRAISTP